MTIQRQIDQLITYRAAEWFELLKSGGEQNNPEFIQWITESPQHLAEFMTIAGLAKELREIDLKTQFDMAALLRRVSAGVAELSSGVPRQRESSMSRSRRWRWAGGIAAGTVVFALSLMIIHETIAPWQRFSTTIGEQRAIELADGSVIHIDAQSRIEVRLSESTRDVRLLDGEAMFKVARDARRPFRVHTREAVVRAVGTQFNVYVRPNGTTVSVLEGKVQISKGDDVAADTRTMSDSIFPTNERTPTALTAGEEARVTPAGNIERNERPNVASAVAWRQRRLIFEKTALEDIVTEFNRYNRAMRLRLEGIEVGSRHYSGTFDADDPESFGAFLSREYDLIVGKNGNEIVIQKRLQTPLE